LSSTQQHNVLCTAINLVGKIEISKFGYPNVNTHGSDMANHRTMTECTLKNQSMGSEIAKNSVDIPCGEP